MKSKNLLRNYVESLPGSGLYWFQRDIAINTLNITPTAFKLSIFRLLKEKRVMRVGKDFYITIPLEYRAKGVLPPYWYINPFMEYLNIPYYVCLLTAASYHGASHQAVQQFQVMTEQVVKMGKTNTTNLSFFTKKNLANTPIEKIKVTTGYVKISTKEATAFDLVQYYKASGYWNHIATVLSELGPILNPKLLIVAAEQGRYETTSIQRLGYLLDHLGHSKITGNLSQFLNKRWEGLHYEKYILLNPGVKKNSIIEKNTKWRILINDIIEGDEV